MRRFLPVSIKRILVYRNIVRWIKEFKSLKIPEPTGTILVCAVVSHFWIIEMVYIALHLRAKGNDIVLLVNKSLLKKNGFLVKNINKLNVIFKVVFINNELTKKNIKDIDPNIVTQTAVQNICYHEKIEYYDCIIEGHRSLYDYYYNEYLYVSDTIDSIISDSRINKVIVPSGFIYESAPIYDFCKKNSINVITFETYSFTTGKRIIGRNELAVRDFSRLNELVMSHEIEQYLEQYIQYQERPIDELERKTGYLAYQNSNNNHIPESLNKIIKNGKPNILVATTVTGDSSTIGVFSPFGTQSKWIKEVLSYLSDFDCNVIVRIHPVEQLVKPKFHLGILLKEYIYKLQIKNVFLVQPEDNLNTFSLTNDMKFILTWVSTVSADFAIRDKLVLLAAKAPFAKLGFCYYEESSQKYFERLNWLLNADIEKQSLGNKTSAMLYIYFLFNYRVYSIDRVPGKRTYNNYSLINSNPEMDRLLRDILCD